MRLKISGHEFLKKGTYNEAKALFLKAYFGNVYSYSDYSSLPGLTKKYRRRNYRACLERLKGKTFQEIGRILGLSPARTRQIIWVNAEMFDRLPGQIKRLETQTKTEEIIQKYPIPTQEINIHVVPHIYERGDVWMLVPPQILMNPNLPGLLNKAIRRKQAEMSSPASPLVQG